MTVKNTGVQAPADSRQTAAASWAASQLGLDEVRLEPVSGDASFRRYFRFHDGLRSVILMDAPPEKEDSAPFVDIARRLKSAGLNAPSILTFDLDEGFGLLEDFGDTLYRELINEDTVDAIFPELFSLLDGLARRVDTDGLPHYSAEALLAELDLFKSWYLEIHRQRPMSRHEQAVWSEVCSRLVESALNQPQVFVHKDFHSCNLLDTPAGPGIIDFQDGLRGPVSYDLASLIWDRYVAWPRPRLETWMSAAHAMLPVEVTREEWIRCCDWMGLQRNLKIVGIFARLRHRDDKQGYTEMIPRFYQYLLDVLPRYPEFRAFNLMLEQKQCAP
jgi:aminoglycoside/choline kinase family phosphotransferase